MTSLVLASGSPRRLELLRAGGLEPRVVPADVDETPQTGEAPPALVRRLARAKALAVAGGCGPGAAVLGADTEVALDDRVLGKPRDDDDARAMLRALSGRELSVWSGVAVASDGTATTRVIRTRLRFRTLDDAAVEAYLATGESAGVAGAFRIQGAGADLVAERRGCLTNVIGLPTCRAAALLARVGLRLAPDDCVPQTPAAS